MGGEVYGKDRCHSHGVRRRYRFLCEGMDNMHSLTTPTVTRRGQATGLTSVRRRSRSHHAQTPRRQHPAPHLRDPRTAGGRAAAGIRVLVARASPPERDTESTGAARMPCDRVFSRYASVRNTLEILMTHHRDHMRTATATPPAHHHCITPARRRLASPRPTAAAAASRPGPFAWNVSATRLSGEKAASTIGRMDLTRGTAPTSSRRSRAAQSLCTEVQS